MNKNLLTLLIVVCILACVECQKGKNKGRGGNKRPESSEIESCDELCERKTMEMSNDRGRECSRSQGKARGCRGSNERGKSKGKGGRNNEMQRLRDCECEKRRMVR